MGRKSAAAQRIEADQQASAVWERLRARELANPDVTPEDRAVIEAMRPPGHLAAEVRGDFRRAITQEATARDKVDRRLWSMRDAGFSWAEIAEDLGLSEAGARMRGSRGRDRRPGRRRA